MTEITAHGQISKNIFLSGENAKSLALKKHFIMFRLGYLMRIVATWAFTVPRKVYFFFGRVVARIGRPK